MEISAKQLRIAPGKIIAQVNNGQDITITYRGKPTAKIVPFAGIRNKDVKNAKEDLFGLWKDRDDAKDVEKYVRTIRKGRTFDN
jgi:prevent-host-death family protein